MSSRLSRSSPGRSLSDDAKAKLLGTRFKFSAKASERILRRAELIARKPAAKSAAHEGVVARPMDRGLSNSLAIKRAQFLGRGTSVKRLSRHAMEDEEEQKKKEQDALREKDLVQEQEGMLEEGEKGMVMPKVERGTSVARSRSVYTAAPIVRSPIGSLNRSGKKNEGDEVQDLPI
jgi:hypothetical protein